jgi:type VI secretion system protein ImpH
VSLIDEMKAEPWRFDFYSVMRKLERSFPDRPRIGDSSARREEYADLGQDPFMDFPASNLERVTTGEDGRLRIYSKFLGMLGPQGALPLTTTEESMEWMLMRDDAFPRFLDLFNHRFLQLFFRAWSDARAIAQHDRPKEDRFIAYVGSTVGLGSGPFRDLDSVPDPGKLAFAGLVGPQAKTASRLRSFLSGLFDVKVEIDQFVGTWLTFDPSNRTRIGQAHSGLGSDLLVGASVFSVQDKIRVRIFTRNMRQFERFLPSGDLCEPLADAVYFYIGDQLEWETELALPAGEVEPTKLGSFGRLGWTSWSSPNWASSQAYRCDTRFHPAERMAMKRKRAASS